MLKQKSAFTLVELAIVLVIIGLIVGGVLAGRDLIVQATTKAQISQIEKLNAAVHTFQGKYGGIPGDLYMTKATQFGFLSPAACNGTMSHRDGNGLIDGFYGSQIYAGIMKENALFWTDLGQSKLIDFYPSVEIANNASNICAGAYYVAGMTLDGILPGAKIGTGNYINVYEENGANWYMVEQIGQVVNTLTTAPSIPVIQARDMDEKLDDGAPTTGSVMARALVSGSQSVIAPTNAQATDSATSCYNTGNNKYSVGINDGQGHNCGLSFKVQ